MTKSKHETNGKNLIAQAMNKKRIVHIYKQ